MELSIDGTFIVQIISFLVLWGCLHRLLFAPVQHVLEQRQARTRGNVETAERLRAESEDLRRGHEERVRETRRALSERSEEERKAWREEERALIAEARNAAAARLAETRAEIEAQVERARPDLQSEAADIASRVAARVLGRGSA